MWWIFHHQLSIIRYNKLIPQLSESTKNVEFTFIRHIWNNEIKKKENKYPRNEQNKSPQKVEMFIFHEKFVWIRIMNWTRKVDGFEFDYRVDDVTSTESPVQTNEELAIRKFGEDQ